MKNVIDLNFFFQIKKMMQHICAAFSFFLISKVSLFQSIFITMFKNNSLMLFDRLKVSFKVMNLPMIDKCWCNVGHVVLYGGNVGHSPFWCKVGQRSFGRCKRSVKKQSINVFYLGEGHEV